MLSPQVSVTSPDGANLPTQSTRRRGLSYLRGLSQSRLGGGSPQAQDSTRTSPRSYFSRSTSYNDPPQTLAPDVTTGRRRSASRPNEYIRPVTNEPQNQADNRAGRNLSPNQGTRRARSLSGERETRAGEGSTEAQTAAEMARHRTGSKRTISTNAQDGSGATGEERAGENHRRSRDRHSTTANGDVAEVPETKTKLPTIRFLPHQEIRNGRQSLNFTPVSRTLPNDLAIIRVGRYSEREGIPITNPTTPSDAPVGFKSKVVSRKHCEFNFVNGQWHVRDVASSSGTFLNHIRLSQPNMESRLYPVKDGDILQLGIDFRGGEEMIFRCVKIRIECNRSWQKRPNNFNKTRHAQLQSLTKDPASGGENTGECAICLGPVHPIQALFVAPCAHVWHYKCIRPMLEGKNSTYPQFQCPNCRAYSDLSAEVDIEPEEDTDEEMVDAGDLPQENGQGAKQAPAENASRRSNGSTDAENIADVLATGAREPRTANGSIRSIGSEGEDRAARSPAMTGSGLLSRRQAANPESPEVNSVNSIDLPDHFDADETNNELAPEVTRTESPDGAQIISGEGPLTPRNNAGPFVFDGSAGRPSGRRLIVSAITENDD